MSEDLNTLKRNGFHTKAVLSRACRDIVEDLLKKSYMEDFSTEGNRPCGDGSDLEEPPPEKFHDKGRKRKKRTERKGGFGSATAVKSVEKKDKTTIAEMSLFGSDESIREILKPPNGMYGDESSAENIFAAMNAKKSDRCAQETEEEMPPELPDIAEERHDGEELDQMIENMSGNVREALDSRRNLRQRGAISSYQHIVPPESELAALPADATFVEQIPSDLHYLINYVQGQGDNPVVEGLHRQNDTRRGPHNVVVNVNFSDYTKFIVLLFTINTLILLKILFWEHVAQYLGLS